MEIDWLSDESHVLLNPRMPAEERARLLSFVRELPGHVWLSTSGTTGALKLTALSKRALLASAVAVNRRLECGAGDVWLRVLPTFHVGGLGILARAFLSGARVVTEGWEGVTLASLVPAQVGDLVRAGVRPPASLRSVLVGAGVLSAGMYRAALDLGWPLLPSYGMTECGSTVAAALPGETDLVLLDHIEARVESDGCLALRSEALLSGYATDEGFVDPKREGWFVTEDVAALAGRVVRILGRVGDFVKIGGESVDLSRLDRILEEISVEAAVLAVPDARLGHVIGLAVAAAAEEVDGIVKAFNARVFPFERIRRVVRVGEIPRTALGKIMRGRLIEELGSGERDEWEAEP